MDRPLQEHIRRLELTLEELNAEIMENRVTQGRRNEIEAEIRAATLALGHYRAALELEKSLTR